MHKLILFFLECPYKKMTGEPCLFCGATRGFLLALRGRLAASFDINPLGFFLFLFTAAAFVIILARFLFKNQKEVGGMIVNLEGAFKYPLKDGKWLIKVLIGGALLCVPIANFLVFGYLLKILADAKNRKEAVLPEWVDWGNLFQEGFMAFVVVLCYSLILGVIGILGLLPIIGCLANLLQIVVGFLLGPIIAVALCFYLEKKELGAAFDFKGIIEKLKANVMDYVVIALIVGVLGAVSMITFVLAVFIWFYLLLVSFRLYGELFSAEKPA